MELRRAQLIVHRGLGQAILVSPGVFMDPYPLKAQGLIDVLGPLVLQVGVQYNLPIAQLPKEIGDEQAQGSAAQALLLAGEIADLDAMMAVGQVGSVFQSGSLVISR